MRTKLFLSYSKGDTPWRELFLKHLQTMVSFEDGLWVDRESIGDGAPWNTQIAKGLADSRHALLLLTPRYLALGGFANDKELPMLLEEQARGLQLLPVLVEPCSWDEHPELGKLQFVSWRNGTKLVTDRDRQREVIRALSEAGDEFATEAAQKSAIDRAVMDVCEHVRKAFGVVGQITGQQRRDLFEETKNALEGERVALDPEPIHCGDFAVIYRGTFEVEGHLARGLTLSTGQLVNWDVLTMLTPEIYGGCQPITRADLDAHNQYYLALLGLELLLGRRPVEVSCFQDLNLKAKFFDDPRPFFDDGADGSNRWTDECPALAYVLARMLSRVPGDRLPSARVASDELRRVSEGRLPESLRRSLEGDLGTVICEGFGRRFYDRLFKARRPLKEKFRDPDAQSRMLAQAIRDLVEFRRDDRVSRFRDHVDSHKKLRLTAEDVEAFRVAFVAEIVSTCDQTTNAGRIRGDAWNAALKLGLGVMAGGLAAEAEPAGLG